MARKVLLVTTVDWTSTARCAGGFAVSASLLEMPAAADDTHAPMATKPVWQRAFAPGRG